MRRSKSNPAPTPDEIVEFFLMAYRQGAFPMADMDQALDPAELLPVARTVRWYFPDPRAILPLSDNALHIPSGTQRQLKNHPFTLTSDTCFEQVIRSCAKPGPTRGGAWLDESLVRCYCLLHQRGHAHSIEVRLNDALVGGIYGVSIGSAFFAESMFADIPSGGSGAANLALITLWHHLRRCAYTLLDVQIANDHTARFGVTEIPADEYLKLLEPAVEAETRWQPLDTSQK